MKHKHYDLIVAWANGAKIEARLKGGEWHELSTPAWNGIDTEYRIKPEEKKPVVRYLWAIDKGNGFELHHLFVDEQSIPYFAIRYPAKRLDWSRAEFDK
jgi:hypothetical protein